MRICVCILCLLTIASGQVRSTDSIYGVDTTWFWLNFGFVNAPPGHFGAGHRANTTSGPRFWTGGFLNAAREYEWLQGNTVLAMRISLSVKARCIVTRKIDELVPTWDGLAAAFIFEPTIWYYDPNSDVEDIGFKPLQPTRPYFVVNDQDGRQSFLSFWIVGFERFEPPPFEIFSRGLYR